MKVFRKLLKNFNHENSHDDHKLSIKADSRKTQNTYEDDISDAKSTKLHSAVLSGKEADVRKHLSKRNINEQNASKRTPLHLAVMRNSVNIIKILLSNGASVEIYDDDGMTPFLKAVEKGYVESVKVFRERELSESQTDFNGNTALHLAVRNNFYQIAELLVQNFKLIDTPNKVGDYPLHLATRNESFSISKLLLDNRALIDVEDSEKNTPLLIAVKMENVSLVQLFLKYGAKRNKSDINGISIEKYALQCKNISIKSVLFGNKLDPGPVEEINKMLINDDDSLVSDHSCVLPPKLETPRSWNILHSTDYKKNEKPSYRKNVRSLSFDIRRDHLDSVRSNSYPLLNTHNGRNQMNNSKRSTHLYENEEILRLEYCQKALDKLSLDSFYKSANDLSISKNVIVNDSRTSVETDVRNAETNAPVKSASYLWKKLSKTLNYDAKGTIRDHQHTSAEIVNESQVNLMKHSSDDLSDSSREDPLIWKTTFDGGYFTADQTGEDKYKTSISQGVNNSSSSDEDEEVDTNQVSTNVVLDRLKQITRENQDLETEAAILREAAEKLKYDLANCRMVNESKESNLAHIEEEMTQLNVKYLKTVEKINSFQLCINNLEQELEYVKQVCNKFHKINRQLMVSRRPYEKNTSDVFNEDSTRKLQADVLYWKTKYEELVNYPSVNHFADVGSNNLLALNVEISRFNNKIKNCLSKADVAEFFNQQQIMSGKMVQQVLKETDFKWQSYIADIKREIQIHENLTKSSDSDLKLIEYENTKQKLLLQVSKLTVDVKEKDGNEQRLKNQLSNLRTEIQNLKSEKHKSLIKRAFEDHPPVNEMEFSRIDSEVNLVTDYHHSFDEERCANINL